MDNTVKAKEAIASLNPLCVFRYSATHKDEINLLYRLTPVDAYQKGLVKQICVSSNQIEQDFNRPYIALKSVSHEHGFKARLELDIAGKNGIVSRKTVTVRQGDDLYRVTGGRELYRGYIVSGINCMAGDEAVEFSDTEIVKFGHALGDVNTIELKRAQIYRTIETHLDKELRFVPLGIKVLSLFFIDEVAKYRSNDEEPAFYERMFEECYEELLAKEKYASLRTNLAQNVRNVHGGYFSQDKKGVYKDTKGDSQADDDTYNTIMRDKEWLLSFACPLRFIFSHSALKEGWDNPNVFQVCMLIEQKSNFTVRQKIGRGLRLCVNQQGEQVEDKDINVLHVMVNESFSEFISTLQKELEADIGYKLGTLQMDRLVGRSYEDVKYVAAKVEISQAQKIVKILVAKDLIDEAGVIRVDQDLVASEFEAIGEEEMPRELRQEIVKKTDAGALINVETLQDLIYTTAVTETKILSSQETADILVELREKGLLTSAGKITDTLKAQWATGTLDLSERFSKGQKQAVLQALEASQAMPIIRNATREVQVKLKKQTVASPEFLDLWEKINKKTTYRAKLDHTEFVAEAVDAVEKMAPVAPAYLVYQTAEIELDSDGMTYEEQLLKQSALDYSLCALPNIVHYLASKLKLTAKTIIGILMKSGREHEFVKNPQAFLERIEEILNKTYVNLTIDGIKYLKLAGQEYSVQEFFTNEELVANLERTAVVSEKSVYDHVVYESSVEKEFAQSLENDPEVRLFFKLPRNFKIATPIGSYTPDWAIFLEQDGEQKLYFVLETKGANSEFDLRLKEMLKIKCGKAHFAALQTGVAFNDQPVTNWREYKRTLPEGTHEFPSAAVVVPE
ncbi:type III restriction enzyme [Bartonella japonica]|uniref:Type III restriction enzyme n=1 Tax=Bartonella japonica TaxID=357761 RepID=A0ABV2FP99_9HYPH